MIRIKQIFCKHDWEIGTLSSKYCNLRGEQLWRRCKKCGKMQKWIFREYEGGGYK